MQYHLLSQYRTAVIQYLTNHKQLFEKYSISPVLHQPRQTLLKQDAAPHSVFILSSGLVKVVHTTSLGQRFTWGVFERGEVVGDVEAIMNMHYFSTVETVTQCSLWKVAPEQFLQMLSEDAGFNLLIHQAMISKLLNTSYKAAIQSTNKLFYSLLIVLREFSRLNELEISKQLLSETLGTSLRNLNRLLVELEQEKVIRIEHTLIKEINFPGLQQKIHAYENAIQ
ncbi:Crp/Fnr family transcriptional regulator [Rhodocytophaga aerolata]|uniref:Crp/Fnr family transcriptional regulator n=1 Tax=Rhodocytophaga aerolata TaxID=455078 RepID=A0ABT8RFB5_9BACT|nr:Crp/Fnr family transcriptional regulator [Rhodocytophaga aerolata]MDO1450765.1 Crp/Fnr family transcriptional regulator [Rhodocytophaga aerolata]